MSTFTPKTNSATSTRNNTPPSNNNNNRRRRSARVPKRDPIVAPGFGTQKDLENLASCLGLPTEAVHAIMDSRGRGIRSRKRGHDHDASDAAAATATTPVSTAWADFMTEEGMSNEEPKESTVANNVVGAKTSTDAAAAAVTTDAPRDYQLPLVKEWSTTTSSTTTTTTTTHHHKSKKKKTSAKPPPPPQGYVLVQTGTLDSSMIGRTKRPLTQPFDLTIPTSILPSLKVTRVIASCSAAHALCIDTNGIAYGWGRNEALQLSQSLPSTAVVPLPTMLEYDFGSVVVVDGAVGKSHTLLLTQKGELYSVGANKAGQCGVRNCSTSVVNFRKCVGLEHETMVQVSCGDDFSVALCNDGHIYSTGSSEFGQLGNGDPGEYIVTAGKSGFANCNVFTKRDVFCHVPGEGMHMAAGMSGGNDSTKVVVPMQEHVRIGYIACGKHHTVAIEATCTTNSSDEEAAPPPPPPRVFTWGCGNYGCLGHGVQQDEYHPRLVTTLSSGPLWTSNPPVRAAAGSSCTMILTERGHVYYCGRHRSVAEAVMRPTLLDALANNNHVVTHIAAGNATVVCSTANGATVSWGMGPHGELGYGEKKSSAKPDFIPKLDSCRIRDLACGQGITLFAIAEEDADDKKAIQKLPVLDAKDVKSLES